RFAAQVERRGRGGGGRVNNVDVESPLAFAQRGKVRFNLFETVALGGNVGEADVTPLRVGGLSEQIESGLVGKVAVAAAYALFGAPGARLAALQHIRVVVRLDNQQVTLAGVAAYCLGHIAKVGQPADGAGGGRI